MALDPQRDKDPTPPEIRDDSTPPNTKVVPADQLFEGKREILIEHGGVRYRLRLTRRNRLILQK